ncbi:EG45-like domain containing protein [Iris pallida]|uniref:EG45-like domain containing protein n=1 Tax=Iris pallida TaxID=29817 RepID=A0AAX6EEI6_IRIPA|nr:EG45-like domain containing protein [Iris pallida]
MHTNTHPTATILHCSLLFFLLLLLPLVPPSGADVGTAASYGPPYLPTVCFGDDRIPIPTDNLFAAAGEGIWNNGASCGRQYMVRCMSSTGRACLDGDAVVQVKVVDRASMLNTIPSANGTTMVLSGAAFRMIADISAQDINIEFAQV